MYQYLLTPEEQAEQARGLGLPLVHMAFQIREDGQLHHRPLPDGCRGGLMLVGTQAAPARGPARQAAGAILTLCRQRGFRGVVIDREGPPVPYLDGLLQDLEQGLAQQNRGLFLPEAYARYSARAFLYLSSAVSGGSLRQRLEEAVRRYGAARLVLSLQRTAEEFPLPAPSGQGDPLDGAALRERMERLSPRVFFSQDLCANYFTYLTRQCSPRFVLFDTARTLREKRALALGLGIARFFLLYPELEDLLPALLAEE